MYSDFVNALAHFGLAVRMTVMPDGKIHRAYRKGHKKGSLNAWWLLFERPLIGVFGDWKTGERHVWKAHDKHPMTLCQKQALAAQMAADKAEREAEEVLRHKAAQGVAQEDWGAAPPLFCHAHLRRKGVKSYGLRRAADGRAMMPLYDANGTLWNLERVAEDGTKRTLHGGRVKGLYFPIVGAGGAESGPILIGEGYTTGASLRACTGHSVAVARNAGNLLSVALALRGKYPNRPIILCGDDDHHLDLNIGRVKATEAATAIKAALCFPPAPYNDFNDWACALHTEGSATL